VRKRGQPSAPPKRHTLNCAKCGREFPVRLRSAAYCSRDCRNKAQAAKAARRRLRGPNPREQWRSEVTELTGQNYVRPDSAPYRQRAQVGLAEIGGQEPL
jgi:hypothetical protein